MVTVHLKQLNYTIFFLNYCIKKGFVKFWSQPANPELSEDALLILGDATAAAMANQQAITTNTFSDNRNIIT